MTGTDRALAAVVAKARADVAIESLREEGVYDDARRVREYDDGTVALPVTAPPARTDVVDVVEQVDPDPRVRNLDDLLRERGWSEAEVASAPSSWAVVGTVVLVALDGTPRPEEVGAALLDLHGEADTVLARGGISGEHREPDVEVVAGSGDTETVHVEHGTKYALDLAEVMFSPGNEAERVRMGDVVEAGERVLDMFAGVGYFALPMARAGADVTAVERNPAAFRYLLENAVLNGVDGRMTPVRADCRDVVGADPAARERSAPGVGASAERVVMGYYDAHEYLDAALDALEPGGTVHLHEATPEPSFPERPVSRLEDAAAGRDREATVLDTRVVKSHSEGVVHGVVDARID